MYFVARKLPVLDAYILPLSSGSEEGSGRSAFLAAQPAKKVARQRKKDRLFLHLSLHGGRTLPPDKHALLLQRLSEVFYKTPGTTTGALRAVAESLNQFLFERNARLQSEEDHTLGYLTQIVQGGEKLTIAQSGISHVYWIRAGKVDHFYDPDLAGLGLGSGKIAKVRFVQGNIQSDEILLVCSTPSAKWRPSFLTSLHGLDPNSLQLKLLDEAGMEAWAIQFKGGAGKIYHLTATPNPKSIGATLTPPPPSSSVVEEKQVPSPLTDIELKPPILSSSPSELEKESSAETTVESSPSPEVTVLPQPKLVQEKSLEATDETLQSHVKRQSASILDGVRQSLTSLGRRLVQGFSRYLPDSSVFQIPTAVMAIIAILTPLVVVALASVVYFRQGQVGEFERYLRLAEQAAQQAQTHPDPIAQRSAWEATLAYLDRAMSYSNSSEAQALRAQAYAAIDQLEAIKRLDLAVAMDDLPKEAQIIKIAVTDNEIFLLDANSGVVWRAAAAARGYVLNPNSSCGPGIQGAAVGKLIGFGLERKATQLQAVIVGVDSNGRLVTCDYNKPPVVESLTPDERGMGTLRGFIIERSNGYVLDPDKNAVWIYWKNKFGEKPELFFSEDVPPMQDVVDFAVYGEDLYLLYQDGHLAQCTYNDAAPTRCVDPQPYKDSRPGRENQLFVIEKPFTRLYVSQPPDPALYLLEASSPAIYQFSLRSLAFHAQFRSISTPSFSPLPQGVPATALAVSAEQRLVFIAFGNQLYYANLP